LAEASFCEILEEGDDPPSLYAALAKNWKVSTSNSPVSDRQTRTGYDIEVGAQVDTGTGILSFLGFLVFQKPVGLERLTLAVVLTEGGVDIVHSLFLIHANEYKEALPEVWGVVGVIPREGFPTLTKLNSMLFVTNAAFTGTSPSEFEAHITSLQSIDPRDFDYPVYQVPQEEDEGSCSIYSKGASFIPTAVNLAILKLGAGASITEVACRVSPTLNNMNTTNFEAATDWLQASFTTRGDGSYISSPIHTRQDLTKVSMCALPPSQPRRHHEISLWARLLLEEEEKEEEEEEKYLAEALLPDNISTLRRSSLQQFRPPLLGYPMLLPQRLPHPPHLEASLPSSGSISIWYGVSQPTQKSPPFCMTWIL